MPRNFPDWRRGDPADAERLNRQHKARNQGIIGGRGIDVVRGHDGVVIQLKETRIIPSGGGVIERGGHQEVVINGVFQAWPDCVNDPGCSDAHDDDEGNFRPHLGCNPVLADGTVDQATYIPVYPNWGHTLTEFAPVVWNVNNVNQPTFSAFAGLRGWTMDFGQGERWVGPPTNLCGKGTPDPDALGACCQLGDCTDTTQADCTGTDTDWMGAGTSCADDPDPCAIGEATGACCCTIPAACHNPKLPGDTTCWNGPTQTECENEGGVWQGANSQCGGSPGICDPMISGACCLPGPPVSCVVAADDIACGLMGGTFLGGSCEPNPCVGSDPIGACCNGKICTGDQTEEQCLAQLGIWFEGQSCSSNPC